MARDPHAYEAYYPLSFWSGAIPGGPVLMIASFLGRGSGPFRERLIATAIITGGVLLLFWACAAKFGRIIALRVNSAGITVRIRRWEKKPATLPWNHIAYLVIWHDEQTTSLSVQPRGGTAQPMLMPRSMFEPGNYVTIKAKALDEQRLLSAVTRYGPAVQIVDGNTGSPVTGSPDEHRTHHMSRRSRFQELTQTWRDNLR